MAKNRIPPLIIECPEDMADLNFLSVLEYRNTHYLVVVDNITDEKVNAYVLDYASQEKINTPHILSVISNWVKESSDKYPLSFEFSKLNMTQDVNKIYKSFELVNVTRLIGNVFKYSLQSPPKIKRRRITKIPAGVEIKLRSLNTAVSPH